VFIHPVLAVPPAFPRESVFSIVYWKDKIVEKPGYNGGSSDEQQQEQGE
jgi:hypothetical protein